MSMIEWAEKEIELACKREAPDREEGEWDYGCACYESALKAFKSLAEDDHSGYSIGFTKQILIRLIEGKPLTPIEDTEDVWGRSYTNDDGVEVYQCKRMSSLFKYVYPDGIVKYSDIDRWFCVNLNSNITYHSSLVNRTLDAIYPITMPYIPGKSHRVYCQDFLVDPANGDFDTVAIYYFLREDGERVDVYRYFTEDGDGWRELSHDEFLKLEKKIKEKENVNN